MPTPAIRNRGKVLSELHTDETHFLQVGITKQVVNTITDGATLGNPRFDIDPSSVSGGVIEIQALNKMRSVTICSKLLQTQTDLDALAVTIPGTIDFPWPSTLDSVTLVREKGDHTQAASGVFTQVTIGGSYNDSGCVVIGMKHGPRSKSVSSLRRTFWATVPTISDVITKIQTTSGGVVVFGETSGSFATYSASSAGTGVVTDTTSSISAGAISIPECLTNGVTLGSSGIGLASATMILPDSTPVSIASATQITVSVEVSQWRFGVYVMEVLKCTKP